MLRAFVAAEVLRVGVLGLFHPTELVMRPAPGQTLDVEATERLALGAGESLRLRADGNVVRLRTSSAALLRASSHGGEFILGVPGKIERRYRGELEITAAQGRLVAVVALELETAVESAVAAESPPKAPMEARMAQAVVTRSFYVAARGRHHGFDFCDTTHCQFLRHRPPPGSSSTVAAQRTRGLVLGYQGRPLAAFFSASCGGRTRVLPHPAAGEYPYFAVDCVWCRRGPRVRCSYCDPRSRSAGHGMGLCQTGANGMAEAGATFRQILSLYFPNTELLSLP